MYGSSFTDQVCPARRLTSLDVAPGAGAEDAEASARADEVVEDSEDKACARADEASKLRPIAKPTKNSTLQALGKRYRMHPSFGKNLSGLISAANQAMPGRAQWCPSRSH